MPDWLVEHLPKNDIDAAFLGVSAALVYLVIAYLVRLARYLLGYAIHSRGAFYQGFPMNAFHFGTAIIIISLVGSPNYKELLLDFRMVILLAGLLFLINTIGWLIYASRDEEQPPTTTATVTADTSISRPASTGAPAG